MESSPPSRPAPAPTTLRAAAFGPDLLGVLALAVAAFFIVAGGAVMYGSVGWLDPWIYTSYIHAYGALLERFGRTYYSIRVAAIWPQGIAYRIFGDQAYLVIRWVVLLACGGGVAAFIRQRAGRWVAYSAGLAVMFSTPLLLEIQNDYTQDVGIAYALVALPFLMARRPIWALLGGVLVSLAVNAHEGLLYVVIPLLAGCIVATVMRSGVRRTLLRFTYVIVGFFAAQGLLSLIMGLKYGWVRSNYFFQEISIQFYGELSGGLAANWSVPWHNDYGRIMTMTIIVGVWLLGATIILALRRRGDLTMVTMATVASAVLIAMVLYSHFVKDMGFVGLTYYLVFASTVSVVVAWLALAATTTGGPSRWLAGTALTASILIGFLLPAWLGVSPVWDWLWWISIAIAFGGLVAAAMPWRHAPMALAVGAVAVAGLIIPLGPLTTAGTVRASYAGVPLADGTAASRNAEGAAVYSLALQFQDYVMNHVPPTVPMLVYYPGLPMLHSIQSTMLWGYSCADCVKGAPGFPRYPKRVIDAFQRGGTKALVLLAPSRTDVLRARAAAARPPLPFSALSPLTALRAGGRVVWVTVSFVPGTSGAPHG